MPGGDPGEGGYPVSFQMNWHGGVHLNAPEGTSDVRAIADGTIAFLRQATKQVTGSSHPLNYRGGWTDDGCVVLRHQTEIGADSVGSATSVVYFSIYQHLKKVSSAYNQGDRVYRKEILGTAGSIYGATNRIHFEIVCDDANVKLLTGRSETYTPVERDGRTDAVFGSIHFLLLVGTQFLVSDPRVAGTQPETAYTSDKAFFVVMTFNHGDCAMQSLDLGGRPIGSLSESAYEYELFKAASEYYPNSPSAGYELLRFGRVLGPDLLNPATAPHWRQVAYPGGTGWVDLNSANVRKFSDADFPFWDHWSMLLDGSPSKDSRCRDIKILQLLDKNGDLNVTPQEAQEKLSDPDLQIQMAHKVCKFSTEWDPSTIDNRWGWLRTDALTRMNSADFARFKAHVSALSFWQQANLGIDGAHWHFHPRQFITHFRKCGWLSLDELKQLMPRNPGPTQGPAHPISWDQAFHAFAGNVQVLNKIFRKYNLLDALRQIHFIAQAFIETDMFRTMREYGGARQQHDKDGNLFWPAPMMEFYAAFYGRGVMQLTWAGNYAAYGTYRQFPNADTYKDNRITHTSKHHWSGQGNPVKVWFPRYDPEIVADFPYNACDSAGHYWVSKPIGNHQRNINRVSDQPFSTDTVGRVSVLVNGGGYGFAERQSYAAFIKRFRDDDTATTQTSNFVAQHGTHVFNIFVDFTRQRP